MIHPPDEWTIAEKPEHPQDEYHPQQSARYERANHDIGVKAMVSDPAPDQPDLWRVTVSWHPRTQQAQTDTLGRVQGRDAAGDLMREFMERYEMQCVEGEIDVRTVIESLRAE